MEVIENGPIPIERLFFYLEEYFGIEYLGKEGSKEAKEIKRIETKADGKWIINFCSFPPQKFLLFIITIFKSKLSHQKLSIRLNLDSGLNYSPANSYYDEGESSLVNFLKYNEEGRLKIVQQYI